jgi:hypothetical protein
MFSFDSTEKKIRYLPQRRPFEKSVTRNNTSFLNFEGFQQIRLLLKVSHCVTHRNILRLRSILCEQSLLPVGHEQSLLPVGHEQSLLPVGHSHCYLLDTKSLLPVGHKQALLPVGHEQSLLPVGHEVIATCWTRTVIVTCWTHAELLVV